MPKMTTGKIVFSPEDRYAIEEQSPGITASTYTSLFAETREGNTSNFFKFLEEIAEKDPDILHALGTRTSNITSKEWVIEGENEAIASDIEKEIRLITGVPDEGLLSIDQLINALLQVSYLTGISMNEIVTTDKKIIGFNHIPARFLTFRERVTYPGLWTQKSPTGVDFNKEKMISHYLTSGIDPARGWLGNAISWQYVLKRTTLDQRLQYANKYGKGFLLLNMPGGKDSFEAAWTTAEELIENLALVDGAVFPADVTADFKEGSTLNGQYFFDSEEDFKKNIVKIILGQTSTSDSSDSNRSTAEVHMDVLETRILEDIGLIENTLTNQLVSEIKKMKGISEDTDYRFTFVMSDLAEELDDDLDTPVDEKKIEKVETVEKGE